MVSFHATNSDQYSGVAIHPRALCSRTRTAPGISTSYQPTMVAPTVHPHPRPPAQWALSGSSLMSPGACPTTTVLDVLVVVVLAAPCTCTGSSFGSTSSAPTSMQPCKRSGVAENASTAACSTYQPSPTTFHPCLRVRVMRCDATCCTSQKIQGTPPVCVYISSK